MATLTNPITPQNIVDRFADFVTATARANIVWGTNALPFPEFADTASFYFGGTTSGRPINITGGNIGSSGTQITAANIYNTLVDETGGNSSQRNLRALLFVNGAGGNTGSRPTPGYVFDQTQVAFLAGMYYQSPGSPSNAGVSSGNTITSANLESFFNNLRNVYLAARSNAATIQINVCHASCHSSCHGSRGRR